MRFRGFIGPSYTLRSKAVDCQRCVNLYPEMDEMHTGKEQEVAALVSTPGLLLLTTLGTGPIRGIYASTTGTTLAVSGSQVYRLDSGSSWSGTLVGTIGTASGAVSMADNGNQIILVDGPSGYIYDISAQTFTKISAEGFPGGNTVTFLDGFFIVNQQGSGKFFISGIYDGTSWDALDFATAEGSPDNLVAVLANRTQLWLLGSQSAEIWVNSGGSDFPFLRAPGAFIQYGCVAPHSLVQLENTIIWLGADQKGQGIVYRAVGLEPQRISTHAVEYAIQSYGVDLSQAVAWTYQNFGHYFYCLSIPGADTTWCYDATTGLWHERTYTNSYGNQELHRAVCHAYAFSTHVVGDRENGNIYALDEDTYTDNGTVIARERIAPHLTDELNRIFYHAFQLDVQAGTGLDQSTVYPPRGEGPPPPIDPVKVSGIDPQAMLRWSDDGGFTWSNEHWQTIGQLGQRRTRVIWRRMGWSRDRVYWVRITAPVKVVLIGVEFDATVGTS
jgi:hypothetical protein